MERKLEMGKASWFLSTWLNVLISHPSTIFLVTRFPSPFSVFFKDMGYFLTMSIEFLGLNNFSIDCKRWNVICIRSAGTSWVTSMSSSS